MYVCSMVKWLACPVPRHGKKSGYTTVRYRSGQYFNNIEKFNILLISPSAVCMGTVVIMLLKSKKQVEGNIKNSKLD